jgi:hypothetical protein
MLIRLIVSALPILALSGCIALGSGPPAKTTVVVPPGSTVSCTNSDGTPCQPTH